MGVTSLIPLGIQGISAATGGKGGGTVSPQGGVSPEQAALAQYTYGQDLVQARSGFADTGTGASTMSTQAGNIARNKLAATEAGQSDLNQQLQIKAQTQLQQLAQQQQNQDQQNQGFAAGSSGSGSGGGFGNTTNTTGDSSSNQTSTG